MQTPILNTNKQYYSGKNTYLVVISSIIIEGKHTLTVIL